jgi:M6 family metalloprotease-like protein
MTNTVKTTPASTGKTCRGMAGFVVCCVIVLMTAGQTTLSAPLRFVSQIIVQPNGDTVHCFASGDEFNNWLHDQENYTIIQDPVTGYYVYALKHDDELIPSTFIVGKSDPHAAGIEKGVSRSISKMEERKDILFSMGNGRAVNAPTKGTLNNIVVYIRFNDEPEFTDSKIVYEDMFNATAPNANSLYNYFKEVSYNQLSVRSFFYPLTNGATVVSFKDSHPRSYYQPYNAVTNPMGYTSDQIASREHTLLENAVNALSSQIPKDLVVDGDHDGIIDNVCFIVYGAPTGWDNLLWPHQWHLYTRSVYINGAKIDAYNLQLQTMTLSDQAGVLCHEMFHSLGSPDLYHYYYSTNIAPVGAWDLMERNMNPPQHMTAYMKYRYGKWINAIQTITAPGTYTLNPLASATNNCYKIASPFSSTEYFVIEYRKRTGVFENSLPGEGLIVSRINASLDGKGNSNGPPDEVYILRPQGTATANGMINNAALSNNTGRIAINFSTDPSPLLSTGTQSGLYITAVSNIDNSISFTVMVHGSETIAGKITDGNHAALSGVQLNGLPGNPVTNSIGEYSVQVPSGWSGTVTPQKSGCSFTPVNRTYSNCLSAVPNSNYSIIERIYPITLEANTPNVQASAGSLIPITIKIGSPNQITSPDDLRDVSFKLNWNNPEYVGYDSYVAGTFLGANPSCTVTGFNDHLEISLARTTGGIAGSGIAIVCTLKVLKSMPAGSSGVTLRVSDVLATQSNGSPLGLNSVDSVRVGLFVGAMVWSGDADNNGVVNVDDVLAIGLNYGKTGSTRVKAGRTWEEQLCSGLWTPVKATYADCDGNGSVDVTDVLCIGINYGKTHVVPNASPVPRLVKTTTPDHRTLSVRMYDLMNTPISWKDVRKGEEFFLSIVVDNAKDILGLSGDLGWGSSTASAGAIEIEKEWADQGLKSGEIWGNSVIEFGKVAEGGGKISLAVSRTNGIPIEGSNAELMKLKMRATDDAEVNVSIDNICANDSAGNRIEVLGTQSTTEVVKHDNAVPSQYQVANYPNPFNPSTTITYQVADGADVSITITDITGRQIIELVHGYRNAGQYAVQWSGRNSNNDMVASGMYFYCFRANPAGGKQGIVKTGKLMLTK